MRKFSNIWDPKEMLKATETSETMFWTAGLRVRAAVLVLLLEITPELREYLTSQGLHLRDEQKWLFYREPVDDGGDEPMFYEVRFGFFKTWVTKHGCKIWWSSYFTNDPPETQAELFPEGITREQVYAFSQ